MEVGGWEFGVVLVCPAVEWRGGELVWEIFFSSVCVFVESWLPPFSIDVPLFLWSLKVAFCRGETSKREAWFLQALQAGSGVVQLWPALTGCSIESFCKRRLVAKERRERVREREFKI